MDERMDRCDRRSRGASARRSARAFVAGLSLTLLLAPNAVQAQGAGPDSVSLVWTAPGDDGAVGTASVYEMRLSASPIDGANWGAADIVRGLPDPLPPGTRQRAVVRGLTRGTPCYFAIRTADEAGNWSGISNLLLLDWIVDATAPAAPLGLTGSSQPGGSVLLTWSANAEADLAGYVVHRGMDAGGPFVALNGPPLVESQYVDVGIPGGSETVWYQLSARDATGNESARSGTLRVDLVAGSAAWGIRPVYPNPSGPGRSVSFRLVVPPGGGSVRVEILNSIGQRVRRMELGSLAPGTPVAQWDGRNDAGREVAPGAYTAWLIAGSTRSGVRLVRVP
jgi:hypothetical protein